MTSKQCCSYKIAGLNSSHKTMHKQQQQSKLDFVRKKILVYPDLKLWDPGVLL